MVFALLKIENELFFARFSIGWNQIVDKIKYDHLGIPNAFWEFVEKWSVAELIMVMLKYRDSC